MLTKVNQIQIRVTKLRMRLTMHHRLLLVVLAVVVPTFMPVHPVLALLNAGYLAEKNLSLV
jgi:hypothetical protein